MSTAISLKEVPYWIDGKPAAADSPRRGEVTNAATGQVVRLVPFANATDVDRAVQSASRAFVEWRQTTPLKRARILTTFRELLERDQKEIARIVSEEHGKVFLDAMGSVQRGIEVVEFAAGAPHLLKGEHSEMVGRDVDAYSCLQPLGVCAGITPFNFPAMVPLWMFPVALACGNTFVLKPSEKDPSASVKMAELLAEAGLPAGVFNIVHGDKEAVDALLAHPDIKAISFVGSTPVAKYIYTTAAAAGKRVQALGGAKNHAVILPDADFDFAADALAGAAYGSAGERCMAISVAVAVGASADPLVERLADKARNLKVGPGTADGMDMGPLVTKAHRDKVRGYVDAGVQEGAELVVDGRGLVVEGTRAGLLPRAGALRSRHPRDDDLQGRDLRTGPGRRSRRHAGRGDRSAQPQSVRQRLRGVHAVGRGGAAFRGRGRSRDGRHQRPDSRADVVLLVWRVEAVALRRPARARQGRHQVLHAHEGDHEPLAAHRCQGQQLHHADAELR